MTDRISITRVLEAPRERVWREWTEPDRFADWFGGVEAEVARSSATMDVRTGGAWRLTMHTSDGQIFWHGEYREVLEPERIIFTLSDQPRQEADALVTVELEDVGDGRTEMRFEQRGSLSPDQARIARYGWSRSFDRIAAAITQNM